MLVEVALLRERERIPVAAAQILRVLQGRSGYAVLALDGEQALEFGAYIGIKDPIDRMVLAAARVGGAKLVSSDEVFDGTGIERVWD